MDLNFKMSIKIFFTWWNKQTFGTFLKTLFFGKCVGSDEYGNKYYKSKKDERWVIYSKNIEATKITSDWYLWIHHTIDKFQIKMIQNLNGKKNIKKIKLEPIIVLNLSKLKKTIKKNMKLGNKIYLIIFFHFLIQLNYIFLLMKK